AVALDGGPDGLDLLRRVAAGAGEGVGAGGWLAPGGHLLIEVSEEQAPTAVAAFRDAGLLPRVATDDDLGATVVIGTRPAQPRPGAPGAGRPGRPAGRGGRGEPAGPAGPEIRRDMLEAPSPPGPLPRPVHTSPIGTAYRSLLVSGPSPSASSMVRPRL